MAGRSALNRGAYVEAALEVIAEVGVDKLSMRNVASRLSVSPMAMYKHFPTKDDLLAAVRLVESYRDGQRVVRT